jgi:hypothetical protein
VPTKAGADSDERMEKGVYSGPKDSARQVNQLDRSGRVQYQYDVYDQVNSDLDLAAGGWARLLKNEKRQAFDAWLFGPLLFEGMACGSLVVELDGLEVPKGSHKFSSIDEKTGKLRSHKDPKYNRYKAIFPRNYGLYYKPCKLFVSRYSEGRLPRTPDMALSAPPLLGVLEDYGTQLQPACLPSKATKVVWKIEEYAGELTECQIYQRAG